VELVAGRGEIKFYASIILRTDVASRIHISGIEKQPTSHNITTHSTSDLSHMKQIIRTPRIDI
jgi:hypothetical protein